MRGRGCGRVPNNDSAEVNSGHSEATSDVHQTALSYARCRPANHPQPEPGSGRRKLYDGSLRFRDGCCEFFYCSATKMRQTGDGTLTSRPVGLNFPVVLAIRYSTIFPLSWLATSRRVPAGSMAKFRGVFPSVGMKPSNVSLPLAGSTENSAMLLSPRFEV